ncbi:MAG: flagellar export chaperone FliS [Oscillospiraceae bacterium]|nr:flagellar export chaperone FliS [Oscillospiraceae bacterium]
MQPITLTNAQDTYRKQAVMTASPAELIVMLYDGLKRNMLIAKRAIGKNDPNAAHNALMKAVSIVEELVRSLDMSVPISEDLLSVYEYMIGAICDINIKKDSALIDPVTEMIQDLKEAWEAVSTECHGSMSIAE